MKGQLLVRFCLVSSLTLVGWWGLASNAAIADGPKEDLETDTIEFMDPGDESMDLGESSPGEEPGAESLDVDTRSSEAESEPATGLSRERLDAETESIDRELHQEEGQINATDAQERSNLCSDLTGFDGSCSSLPSQFEGGVEFPLK